MNGSVFRQTSLVLLSLMACFDNAVAEETSSPPYQWHFVAEGHSNAQSLTDKCVLRDRIVYKDLPPLLIFVDDSVDLTSSHVIDSIVGSASARLRGDCDLGKVKGPSQRVSTIWISNSAGRNNWQFRHNHLDNWVRCQMTLDNPKQLCDRDYTNGFILAKNRLEEQRRRDEVRLAEARAAKAQRDRELFLINQKKEAAARKAQALADRHGVDSGWIDWARFRANPFALEGEKHLFNVRFVRMVSADTALFSANLLAVGVPRTALTVDQDIVLAGKIIEAKNERSEFVGAGPLLRVKYLGHEPCAERDCDDFGTLKTKR